MKAINMPVTLHGEMLGVDCTAGGRIASRRIQNKRTNAALNRSSRVNWWRKLSGSAMWLVRAGPRSQGTYGSEVHGLSNVVLRKLRTLHCAATRLSSAASSTTAKLAIGGEKHAEADPAVKDTGAPLFRTLDKLWDQPHTRAEFVVSWNAAVNDIMKYGEKWNSIRGPVGAAILTVLRANGQWPTPFQIELMGHTIHLLDTPPLQVQAIYKAQARRALDNDLVSRTVQGYEVEDQILIQHMYQYGIDWECIREVLNESGTEGWAGNKAARAALHTVVGRGFWPEERRWRAGIIGSSTCEACFQGCGDDDHKFLQCEALRTHLFWKKLEGTYSPVKHDPRVPTPRLLTRYGWPPIVQPWQPVTEEIQQGSLHEIWNGDSFGDGSGVNQQAKEARTATWAVIRQDDQGKVLSSIRGNVTGWFPTVLRSELMALVMHLKTSVIPARYIGDCLTVINGAKERVDDKLCSSRSLHADLWREVRFLTRDHGEGQTVQKTAAHRSRVQAENSSDDPISWWMGNRSADTYAKELSTEIAMRQDRMEYAEMHRQSYRRWLRHLGVAAQWHFTFWPVTHKRVRNKTNTRDADGGSECGQHQLERRHGQGWQCVKCLRQAWTRQGRSRLHRIPCGGDPSSEVHKSHVLHTTRGVLWCIKCGAHTRRTPVTLTKECVGDPRSGAYRNVIRRLNEGRMPTEGQDREAEEASIQTHSPWERTGDSIAITRIRRRKNNLLDAEKDAMDYRMAMKRRRLTQSVELQPGTAGFIKRLREQASEKLVSKRRRIHDKAAVEKETCAALAEANWVHRVRHCVENRTGECMVCRCKTLTRCRSCARHLCIRCAKIKAQCRAC